MKRLVKDSPQSNVENLLNFAYVKGENVTLRYALGKDNADLCDVVRDLCPQGGAVSSDIMDGRCFECGDMGNCAAGLLYTTAVQAAELRAALKAYEDTGYAPADFDNLCREMSDLRLSVGINTYEKLCHAVDLLKAEQAGRLVVLPCRDDAVLVRDGIEFKADHWNITLTAFAENQPTPSGTKVALFSIDEAAEAALGKEQE